jgi:hypothetical protein
MKRPRSFADFHCGNPHVFAKFRYVASQLRKSQPERGSAEQVWQILRWEMRFDTDDSLAGRFKLNNVYRSKYARLLVRVDPSFKGWFRFRKRKVKK